MLMPYGTKAVVGSILAFLVNCRVGNNDGSGLLRDSACVLPPNKTVVAALPPQDTPGILDDPVLDAVLFAEADDQHRVVDLHWIAALHEKKTETLAANTTTASG